MPDANGQFKGIALSKVSESWERVFGKDKPPARNPAAPWLTLPPPKK